MHKHHRSNASNTHPKSKVTFAGSVHCRGRRTMKLLPICTYKTSTPHGRFADSTHGFKYFRLFKVKPQLVWTNGPADILEACPCFLQVRVQGAPLDVYKNATKSFEMCRDCNSCLYGSIVQAISTHLVLLLRIGGGNVFCTLCRAIPELGCGGNQESSENCETCPG